MADARFWFDRQAEFEKYTERYAGLAAHWKAEPARWILLWKSDPTRVPDEASELLNVIARKAIANLPQSSAKEDREPWQVWLTYLCTHKKKGCNDLGSPIAVSQREWERMQESGESLSVVRAASNKRAWDEAKESGKDYLDVQRELGSSLDAGANASKHWLRNKSIERVFETSADFCFLSGARAEQASGSFEPVTAEESTDPDNLLGNGWQRVPRADWRDDADFSLEVPAFLRPVKKDRLTAIERLWREAKDAIRRSMPPTMQEAEECLWPVISDYAGELFDKVAETRVSGRSPAQYRRWLRSKCSPAVIDDVCRLIFGQLFITARHVVESFGETREVKTDATRRALWGILKEVLGGPSTKNMETRLIAHLEGRIIYWLTRHTIAPRKTGTETNRRQGKAGSEPPESPVASAGTPAETPVGASSPVPERRKSPREFVDAVRNKPRIRSYDKFAAEIGIGRDTLFAITKEHRWVSDDVYNLLAKVCGCKAEELHPRDVPLPDRRRR